MAVEEVHSQSEVVYSPGWRMGWRRLSWGAIWAGLFVTLAVFVTLQLLGAGIGLSAVNLTGPRTSSPTGFGIGAAVWWLVVGLISLFIGGWVAGRLSAQPSKLDRMLHGFVTWAFFYVVMLWAVTTTFAAVAGGSLSLLGKSLSAAGQAAASPQGQQAMQQQGLSLSAIQQELSSALGAGASNQGDLATSISNYFKGNKSQQDRQQLAAAISQKTGKSEAEANQMIDNLDQKAQQAKQTGEQAVNVTGATLIGLAISMILGAIVAVLGSLAASAPKSTTPPYEERRTMTRPAQADVGEYAHTH
jgi:hypothetical protein